MNLQAQILNLAWVLLGIGIAIESVRLKLWTPAGPGSGFIPLTAALIIGTLGLLLFLREGLKAAKKGARGRFWPSPLAVRRILSLLGALCAMAYFMPFLGFLATSLVVTSFMLYVIEPRRWFVVLATSGVSCLAVYLLFAYALRIPLPKGVLGI